MVAMSFDLHALIQQEGSNLQMQGDRVICCLNGHSMPAKADAVRAFINGKRYKKLAWQKAEEEALSSYEPFLVQSKNFPDKLFCSLTCQVMNKTVDNVRKHMKGRRFIQAKEEFEQDKRELLEEPELEASEGSGGSIDSQPPDEAVEVLGEADALEALEAVSMGEEQDTDTAQPQPQEERQAKQPAEAKQQRPKNKQQTGQPSGNKPKKPPRAGAGEAVPHSFGAATAAADGSGAAKGPQAGRPRHAPKTPALMGQKRPVEKMVKKDTNRRKKQRTSGIP